MAAESAPPSSSALAPSRSPQPAQAVPGAALPGGRTGAASAPPRPAPRPARGTRRVATTAVRPARRRA
eukprot:934009-Alexandrium_andersonii.AAC.1